MPRTVWRWAVVWCVLGLTAEPGLFAQDRETFNVPVAAPIVQEVETFAVNEGRLAPSKQASLRPGVSGVVAKVVYPYGGLVKQGDVLFELDARRYEAERGVKQAALQRARAALERAKLNFENSAKLAENRTTSQGEAALAKTSFEEAQATVAEAEAQLAIAQLDVDACRIIAPFSGKLGRSRVNEGEQVSPSGDYLASLAVIDPIAVEWSLTEGAFAHLAADKPEGLVDVEFSVKAPSAQETLKARVVYVGEPTTTSSRSVRHSLLALLPNPDGKLMVGSTVAVTISTGFKKLPLLPERAFTAVNPAPRFGGFNVGDEALTDGERRETFSRGERVTVMGLMEDGRIWTGVGTLGQQVGDLWSFNIELPKDAKVILAPKEVQGWDRRRVQFQGVEETIAPPAASAKQP